MFASLSLTNIEPSSVYFPMLLHCLIGTAAAIIAQQKGQNFILWIILGLIGGTPAIIVSLFMKRKEEKI
ncbi:MAG: hypothetical protein DSM107014_05650 [Gomphosphaeria aponina SAG 52.96 = DSM 107014]|uniref:Uncharacterized protein n=1 Tax=Gomphosphaeria aponina SAG 52.96 = DSM 107014 TaxID=1521640 RepID=A0A941GNG0_9CHRO|nr:hypothetical protein [Gomphosphaeria aponina SAG 52.96 = DSM 107014]